MARNRNLIRSDLHGSCVLEQRVLRADPSPKANCAHHDRSIGATRGIAKRRFIMRNEANTDRQICAAESNSVIVPQPGMIGASARRGESVDATDDISRKAAIVYFHRGLHPTLACPRTALRGYRTCRDHRFECFGFKARRYRRVVLWSAWPAFSRSASSSAPCSWAAMM